MSFVRTPIDLQNSMTRNPVHKFKHCQKCDKPRPPEGGIEMSTTRWICAACWTVRATRTPKKVK